MLENITAGFFDEWWKAFSIVLFLELLSRASLGLLGAWSDLCIETTLYATEYETYMIQWLSNIKCCWLQITYEELDNKYINYF